MCPVVDGQRFSAGSRGGGQKLAAGRPVARKKAAGGSVWAPCVDPGVQASTVISARLNLRHDGMAHAHRPRADK